MCFVSKSKLCSFESVMEGQIQEQKDIHSCSRRSNLLELSAADDVAGFVCEVEDKGFDVIEVSLWYGRRIGSKKMGLEERSSLMIAAMYGSTGVLKYIIGTGKVDVNRACGSDGATALHCAAAGGSVSSVEVIRLLLAVSADIHSVDANGKKPSDLIPPVLKSLSNSRRRVLEMMLKGEEGLLGGEEEEKQGSNTQISKEGAEKKEYRVDVSLPDINNGMYVTDEFRMYTFKIKPCSRAYSHDWTECPFVHPGENARRRDPRKYSYSCVPCLDFKKGTCLKGNTCEYAHGVFESWLHPAQYRTRLCKDETGCARKVCFFAHKPEELRPLYASTGSAMPSPKSMSISSMDLTSPLALGSSSLLLPASSTSTQRMSPATTCSSPPMGGSPWQNKVNFTPPTLQLPGSRLKTAVSARDLELEMDLPALEKIYTRQQQRQQLIDEMSGLSSPSFWNKECSRMGDFRPTNLDEVFGSLNSSLPSQLQCLSPKVATSSQLQSPTGIQMRQNMNTNPLRTSYPSNFSSFPVRKLSAFEYESSGATAAATMNSRAAAFANCSQRFIDRGAVNHHSGLTAATNSTTLMQSNLWDWGSPDGKLDWGFNNDDMNKLKKSASFGFRSGNTATNITPLASTNVDEPDVSWVHSLVKDASSIGAGLYSSERKHGEANDMHPSWIEQLYIEQEQMVA